jgi:hypothetical protein
MMTVEAVILELSLTTAAKPRQLIVVAAAIPKLSTTAVEKE